jgi:hypothetical protein
MDAMKKTLLILRCALEVLFGGFMLLGAVAQIPEFISHISPIDHAIARTVRQAGGILVLGALGYFFFMDGWKVGRRIGSKPLPPPPPQIVG